MRRIASVTILVLASTSLGYAIEVPLTESDASKTAIASARGIANAEVLLSSGLPVSATEIFTNVLEDAGLTPEYEKRVRAGLVRAHLAQNKFEAAEAQMALIPVGAEDYSLQLLGVQVAYGAGRAVDWSYIGTQLAKIDASLLSESERYWYFLMQALHAEQKQELEALELYLKEGLPSAQSAYQRANLQTILLRKELRGPALEPDVLKDMQRELNKSRGTAAFLYAKQYALALWHSDEVEEALDLLDLDKQLRRYGQGFTFAQREELRLLRAMMLGESSTEGQMALAELIRSGQTIEIMEVALYLLSRQSEESVIFTELLNEMLERKEAHPLIGQMYYLRSQLALRRGELELAKSDAELLLEKFPGLMRVSDAYFILAFAALRDASPQYRTAADFLIQHQASLEDEAGIAELNVLIGDCYFLNKDFNNAAEFYTLALNEVPQALESIYLRLVIASIQIGKLEDALRYIDALPFGKQVGAEKRWQAEWNIAHALIKEQRAEDAIGRVRSLLGSEEQVPTMLDLRMHWLELSLALELGESMADAMGQVNSLLDRHAAAVEGSESTSGELDTLAAEFLLLKARVHYRQEAADEAALVLDALRTVYQGSMAAQRSYLLEASELEQLGQLLEAQAVMLQLAEDYPRSPLAAQSIFEGALICERRGVDFYVEAIQLYERLAERYPEDALLYRARMRQGDLLRLLNDFAGARLVYETLVNSDPVHPMRPMAELARAQCMLALAKQDAAKLAQAASVLERLVDMPDLDLNFRVEAMYKWAFALEEQGLDDRARVVLSESVARNLLDVKLASLLDSTGRYWAARTLLDLGERLSARGDFSEAKTVYRKLIAYNLPGRGLAQSRINSIRITNN